MLMDIDKHVPHYTSYRHSAHQWYVIHCKTGKEKSTSEMLKGNLGLNVYLPEKKIWQKTNPQYIPLFPGYFFIQADFQQIAPSQIRSSPGVLRLLECDGVPQAVPSHLVEMIYQETSKLNEHNHTPDQILQPGDTLHVTEGPLRGLETVFIDPTTSSKRVQVLLYFLGRLTKTEIETSILEKRTESGKPRRMRYTRGKGRKIVYRAKNLQEGLPEKGA